MQLIFTKNYLLKTFNRSVIIMITLLLGFYQSNSQIILVNESFNTVVPLPTGWAQQNLSTTQGTTPNWFQGNATVFPSNSGATTAYIAANYNSTTGSNTISNWLFMPNITMRNGDVLTFYTRRTTSNFPDRLQVRLSGNGASVNAGTTDASVGDFTNLLLDINLTLVNGGYPQTWTQFTVTISGLTGATSGRIAFRYYDTNGGPTGVNSDYIGIDDVVYTSFSTACIGTPVPGNTLSTRDSVCPPNTFTLSLQNQTIGSGVTYQWQTSTDNVTWVNATGASATTAAFATTQAAETWYRALVTCSGNTGTSTPVQVHMLLATQCYCIPPNTNCNLNDRISNVTLNTLNNTTGTTCTSPSGYNNYSNSAIPTQTTSLVQGGTYNMSVTVGAGGTEYVGVWIDYNHNGVFEAPEYTLLGSGNGVTITGPLTISPTALLGATRMRVRVRFGTTLGATGSAAGATNACIGYTYGETEDYKVTIIPCVTGAVTTNPSNKTISCGGSTSFTAAASGSNITYEWERRTGPTAPWLPVVNGGVYSGATTGTLTLTNVPASYSGYQYRSIYRGTCTGADFTNAATLTITPFIAPISPVPTIKCQGTALQIFASPPPAVTTVCSPTLNLNIPDNLPAGVSNTMSISGIAAGATISNVSVKINMTHTWDGDMVFVLKAPNGQIINLDYFLNATGGAGATTGFTNTVISSTGTTLLSAGADPYTGTFRADLRVVAAAGPTGFAPTTAVWNNLSSTPNGNWTLAMYDGGAGDVGVLQNWCLSITWGVPASTGVFSPLTDLYTDAAGTIPYTGNSVNSVYTTTTTSTTYTAVVSNATCTSAPTPINVIVTGPLNNVTIPATTLGCIGHPVTITAVSDAGDPAAISYNWEVSTDGGATWSAISNGAVYSGTTTSELTINADDNLANNLYRVNAGISACGSNVTSNSSLLIVNPNPVIVLSANPYHSIMPGLTTTLSAAVSPNAPATGGFTWYQNGTIVPGQNNSSLIVDVDHLGEYYVTVNDVNGCNSQSGSVTITDSTSNIVFIYPSPNTGQFQVRYKSQAGNRLIPRFLNIFDSKGSMVYSRVYSINTPYERMAVDMRAYGKGVYMVELADGSGQRIATGRVVIF